MKIWVDIINNSYDDCQYNIEKAKEVLTNHQYFRGIQTYIFYKGENAVATASIGFYNKTVGGDFRLGVHNDYQNLGYGRLIILYAFSRLQLLGCKYGESAIAFKRDKSLFLHFSLGFRPQYNAKYIVCPIYNKLKRFNFILNYRLRKKYKKFLHNINKEIIV